MSRRTLLVCGGLWVVVCLIGADIGIGAEPDSGAPAADGQSASASQAGSASVQGPGRYGGGNSNSAEKRLGSSAADSLSQPAGVSYQYDALGRIKEIVRVPGK